MKNLLPLALVSSNNNFRLDKLCDKFLPYQFKTCTIGKIAESEKEKWCEENLNSRFCLWSDYICCKNETDLANFILRWI